MKELFLSLKHHFVINTLAFLLILVSLVLMFVTFFYIDSNRITNLIAGDQIEEGSQMKLIVRDMMSGGSDMVNRLPKLYDEMMRSELFDTLIFSQRILTLQEEVREESLGLSYQWGLEWGEKNIVGGIVVNPRYLELFPLTVDVGRAFTEQDFSRYSGVIPIVAGYRFYPYYHLGEVLTATFFGQYFDFEIIGFLKEGHLGPDFNWRGDFNGTLLLPFIDFKHEESLEVSRNFLIDYYLNLIQPWLRMEDTRIALDLAINEVTTIGNHVGIGMTFSEASPVLIRNTITRNIIALNLEAITLFLVSGNVLIGIVLYHFSKVKFFWKQEIYLNLALMGVPKYKQMALMLIENFFFTGLAIYLAVHFLIFGTDLIVVWPYLTRVELFNAVMFDSLGWQVPMAPLLWNVVWAGGIFYLVQNAYPLWKIMKLYK